MWSASAPRALRAAPTTPRCSGSAGGRDSAARPRPRPRCCPLRTSFRSRGSRVPPASPPPRRSHGRSGLRDLGGDQPIERRTSRARRAETCLNLGATRATSAVASRVAFVPHGRRRQRRLTYARPRLRQRRGAAALPRRSTRRRVRPASQPMSSSAECRLARAARDCIPRRAPAAEARQDRAHAAERGELAALDVELDHVDGPGADVVGRTTSTSIARPRRRRRRGCSCPRRADVERLGRRAPEAFGMTSTRSATPFAARLSRSTSSTARLGSKTTTRPPGPAARAACTVTKPRCAPPSSTTPPDGTASASRRDERLLSSVLQQLTDVVQVRRSVPASRTPSTSSSNRSNGPPISGASLSTRGPSRSRRASPARARAP